MGTIKLMDFWSIFMKIIGSDEKSMIFMNPSIITVPVIIHQMYRRTRLVMEPHSENRRSVAACLGFPGPTRCEDSFGSHWLLKADSREKPTMVAKIIRHNFA